MVKNKKVKSFFNFPRINKVVKVLILSDFFLQGAWGFITPLFAVFLIENISGGTLKAVGATAGIYWLSKSLVQPFFARYLDKTDGERDDFIFLIAGLYIANLIPLGYLLASKIWHIYLLEFIRAMAMGWVVPSWAALLTRHIDKGKEAFSWSIESTTIGLAAGTAAIIAGWLAYAVGFKIIFILASIFGLSSATCLFLIRDAFSGKKKKGKRIIPFRKLF